MAYLRRLRMAGETLRAALDKVPGRDAVRHLQAGPSRSYRNRSPHQTRLLYLSVIQRLDLSAAASKLIRAHAAPATRAFRYTFVILVLLIMVVPRLNPPSRKPA
jgi:hypothetical protein